MKKKTPIKDLDYFIKSDSFDNLQILPNSEYLKRHFKEWDYFLATVDDVPVRIYNWRLATILTSEKIPAFNRITKKDELFDGHLFCHAYKDGFVQGCKQFDKDFGIKPDTMYGENAKIFVRDIHHHYYHANHGSDGEGWNYHKLRYPLTITKKGIEKFGFYSGIISRVEDIVKKYPKVFQTFDKCEHEIEYNSFNELYEIAYRNEAIPKELNEIRKFYSQQIHALQFDEFIFGKFKVKLLELSQEQRKKYFTKENFKDYLLNQMKKDAEKLRAIEQEKNSWKVDEIPEQQEQETENNLLTAIENYLKPFKEKGCITENDYKRLVGIVEAYFRGNTVRNGKKVFVKRGNSKKISFALGEIFRGLRTDNLAFDYLHLCKQNITLLENVALSKSNFTKCNLYKYFTTKPHKRKAYP